MDKCKYDDLVAQAMSEQKKGGWDAALAYLNDCIKKTPNFIEAYLARSEIYTRKKDFKEAIDGFSKAIDLDANDAFVYTHRANIYLKINEFQKTISDCTKAIEILPNDNKFPYSVRGRAYAEIGEFAKAIEDFGKAIELPPDSLLDYDFRGGVYVKMGEFTKAFNDFNKVIEIDPKHADAYGRRGGLHAQLGNVQEAINDLEKFLELDPNSEIAETIQDTLRKLKNSNTIGSGDLTEVNTELKKRCIVLLAFTAIGIIVSTIGIGIDMGIGGVLAGIIIGIIIGVPLGIGIIPWLRFAKTALLGILFDFKFIIDSTTPVEGENWPTFVGDIIAAIVETCRESFLRRLGFVLLRLLFWWWVLLLIYLFISIFIGIYQVIKLLVKRWKIKRNG
jgi:tetratricopeptide (TPR) repeat protein